MFLHYRNILCLVFSIEQGERNQHLPMLSNRLWPGTLYTVSNLICIAVKWISISSISQKRKLVFRDSHHMSKLTTRKCERFKPKFPWLQSSCSFEHYLALYSCLYYKQSKLYSFYVPFVFFVSKCLNSVAFFHPHIPWFLHGIWHWPSKTLNVLLHLNP